MKRKEEKKIEFTNIILYKIADGARHPTRTYSEIAVFGTLPPKPISYNEFCPPPNCPPPNCDEHRCNNAYIHHDIEIRQLFFKDIQFPGIAKNRTFGKFNVPYFNENRAFYCKIWRSLPNLYKSISYHCNDQKSTSSMRN